MQQLATKGQCDYPAYETSINSLFITDPESTVEVFGSSDQLQSGLKTLYEVLAKEAQTTNMEVVRYALNMVQLERKLSRQSDMLEIIGKRISQAKDQTRHFGTTHENVIHNIASLYLDTISTFNLRIQVTGNPNYLKIEQTAQRIRAILLAGIRAAMLWHQVGGRRWHLVFKRKQILQRLKQLLR